MYRELQEAREGAGSGEGAVELVDYEHTHVIPSNAVPDEAIEALAALAWSEKRGGYLVWRADRGEWWDPTKRD
jgi:hypothetical protein